MTGKPIPDIGNKQFVGVQGDMIHILRPITGPMNRVEALNLAAWLVTLADLDGDHSAFLDLVKAIEGDR